MSIEGFNESVAPTLRTSAGISTELRCALFTGSISRGRRLDVYVPPEELLGSYLHIPH